MKWPQIWVHGYPGSGLPILGLPEGDTQGAALPPASPASPLPPLECKGSRQTSSKQAENSAGRGA